MAHHLLSIQMTGDKTSDAVCLNPWVLQVAHLQYWQAHGTAYSPPSQHEYFYILLLA